MKILLVSHTFLPNYVGGTEVYTYQLAKEFKKRNKVEIFCSNPLDDRNSYRTTKTFIDRIPVTTIHKNVRTYKDFSQTYWDEKISKPFIKLLKIFKPDIIHYQHLMHLSLELVDIGKKYNIPQVLTLHDFWFQTHMHDRLTMNGQLYDKLNEEIEIQDLSIRLSAGPTTYTPTDFISFIKSKDKNTYIRKIFARLQGKVTFILKKEGYAKMIKDRTNIMRKALASVNVIIFPTVFLFQEFCQWGFETKKVIISEDGINTNPFWKFQKKPDRKIRFAFIGSIIPSKGLDILLKAWGKLNVENAILKIYGSLKVDKKYSQIIRNLAINLKGVFLSGTFPSEKIAEIFSEIDVLVVPSRWLENAPLVIRNAFMSKTPVISTNLGGLSELVKDKYNGLLFENENVDDLASKINYIIKYPQVLKTFKFPKQKSIEENAQELINIYKKLLENKDEK